MRTTAPLKAEDQRDLIAAHVTVCIDAIIQGDMQTKKNKVTLRCPPFGIHE
jgi:hypothetical protein